MFWTIVWAILFVEIWLPLIFGLLSSDESQWCLWFIIAIIILIVILA